VALTKYSFLLCSLLITNPGFAQAARIVRPTRISKASHPIEVSPALAGFRIGEPMAEALKKIGSPSKQERLGDSPEAPVSYSNEATGISVIGGDTEGVGIILIVKREAGSLDGIRVGDSRSTVKARWGQPAAGNELGGLWLSGQYVVAVSFDRNGVVTRLGIGLGQ
jgi:hypothetical protein